MANEITTDNINTKAQEVASIGDGDFVYIFKTGAQGFSRIAASHFAQGGNSNANKIKNIRDNKEYRLWVGSQNQLNALNGVYESDVIYIVAEEVQGTTIPITGISVSCVKSSSAANTYNLTATLSPSNTTQTSVLWRIKSGSSYASLSSNGLSATLTVLNGANNNTVVVECYYDSIVGQATPTVTYEEPSVEVTITDITVSNTLANNIKQCTPVFSDGSSYDVTWVSSDTSIAEINSNGMLTIKATGTVTITASLSQDNSYSEEISVTYTDESVPVAGELDFTHSRTAANTLTLAATKDGSSVNASFALSGAVPNVYQLQNGELVAVPAVSINGNTLTYHDDCTVTVVATSGGDTKTKSITIAHNTADNIWFEDANTKAAVISALSITGSDVTYAKAAETQRLIISNNTDIVRFKEFKWFGVTSIGYRGASGSASTFSGCTNLKCLGLPSGLTEVYAGSTTNPLGDCSLSEIHVDSVADYFNIFFAGTTSGVPSEYASFYYAGHDENGLSLYINGAEVTELVIPSSVNHVYKFALAGFTNLTKVEIHAAAIDGNPFVPSNTIQGKAYTAVQEVVVGNEVQSLPSDAFSKITSLTSADFGTNISTVTGYCFTGSYNLVDLILRYDGVVALSSAQAFVKVKNGSQYFKDQIDLQVPSSQLTSYTNSSDWGNNSVHSITAISNGQTSE